MTNKTSIMMTIGIFETGSSPINLYKRKQSQSRNAVPILDVECEPTLYKNINISLAVDAYGNIFAPNTYIETHASEFALTSYMEVELLESDALAVCGLKSHYSYIHYTIQHTREIVVMNDNNDTNNLFAWLNRGLCSP